jgi:fumarate hydratase class II
LVGVTTTGPTRSERDSMGELQVPAGAYYGASTARAVENFPISERRFGRGFIRALGLVKQAACRANRDLGLLAPEIAAAIDAAAGEVASGRFDDQFVVDVFQTGSGTSTNMNANEVIATRARELLGAERGDRRRVHPNDHVNLGQSTNDVFPTTMHVAAMDAVEAHVLPSLRRLATAFEAKAAEWSEIVKAGRTHLQDAVPMTLGQEVSGYASVVRHGIARIEATRPHLAELAIGGTAVGTGLNAHPELGVRVTSELRRLTGYLFRRADNSFEAMQNRDAAVELSGAVRTLAVGLMKLANDLRLLSSGPRTGLNEIELPATQPGSSIMPGKVNPVIPEAVNMVAAQLIGNDAAIAAAAMNGNLELNTMMPVIAYNLLDSLELLGHCAMVLADKCVGGMQANVAQCREYAERSTALVTAAVPRIGYDAAARVFKRAMEGNTSIRRALREEGGLTEEEIERILDLLRLAQGGWT